MTNFVPVNASWWLEEDFMYVPLIDEEDRTLQGKQMTY